MPCQPRNFLFAFAALQVTILSIWSFIMFYHVRASGWLPKLEAKEHQVLKDLKTPSFISVVPLCGRRFGIQLIPSIAEYWKEKPDLKPNPESGVPVHLVSGVCVKSPFEFCWNQLLQWVRRFFGVLELELRHSLLLHFWAEKVWIRIWAFLDQDNDGSIDSEEIKARKT